VKVLLGGLRSAELPTDTQLLGQLLTGSGANNTILFHLAKDRQTTPQSNDIFQRAPNENLVVFSFRPAEMAQSFGPAFHESLIRLADAQANAIRRNAGLLVSKVASVEVVIAGRAPLVINEPAKIDTLLKSLASADRRAFACTDEAGVPALLVCRPRNGPVSKIHLIVPLSLPSRRNNPDEPEWLVAVKQILRLDSVSQTGSGPVQPLSRPRFCSR
jgi:hypothetical protein